MAIEKNQIPILEYDNSSKEVINPQHEDFKIVIPNKLVFSFCGENVKKFALKNLFRCKKIAQFVTSSGNFPVYKLKIKNQEIGLCMAPTGAAGATQFLDWLIAYGAKEIVGVGSCGCLIEDCEGDLFVPDRALRDEGTSYHYLPANRYINLDNDMINAVINLLNLKKIKYKKCMTWTTDGFFRETFDMVEYRKNEGCSVVEMECASLSACAKLRNAKFGMLLYTADSLADKEQYSKRNWGGVKRRDLILQLGIEILLNNDKTF